ncbi:MAG: hypothetical protein JWP16_1007 [Alphaproteobacteria bacterium]|nr:hypothetical protein [Alphaproteobacteria bacterium]MDB5739967.1 hypothetical protein [Alphaproteobacteria bacterium]
MVTALSNGWPNLTGLDLKPTTDALHLWSQVVGKVRLMLTPWVNHSWHVPLYLSAVGFGTGLIPAQRRSMEIEFDLLADLLVIRDTLGQVRRVKLEPRSVASFYADTMNALRELGLEVRLDPMPCELTDCVPFHADVILRNYDGDTARSYWRAMIQAQRVFHVFRTRFVGKCSPIHLFWGSFDLAVTRFSGRAAPRHPGGAPHLSDAVAREAYSQEVSSAGFWPGGGNVIGPTFYSYAYPAPSGFGDAMVEPGAAGFNTEMGEFLLSYETVARSPDPDAALLDFLQTTYEAAANLARWDRQILERPTGLLGMPPPGV